jgi:pyruvate dehydrogenase E2 component (dihydrolipoamide acetyltransferase)
VAATQGVAIESVPGTGPAGKVVADDVRGAGRAAGGEPRAAEVAPGERQVLSRIRATTARRMSESKREIPHFYLTAEIDMSAAVGLRAQLREASERFAALTFTHLILRATALALGEVPALNASYDEGGVIQHPEINIGIATATPEGLLVPVLRDAAALSLGDVVERARGLAAKADSGRFGRDEMTGGTFTVSNLGMYPVEEFAAVINPPQAGILAVGAIRERPVARAGRIEVGHLMRVTLSCDHRVVDGVTGGQFLRAFKEILERPARLLL